MGKSFLSGCLFAMGKLFLAGSLTPKVQLAQENDTPPCLFFSIKYYNMQIPIRRVKIFLFFAYDKFILESMPIM